MVSETRLTRWEENLVNPNINVVSWITGFGITVFNSNDYSFFYNYVVTDDCLAPPQMIVGHSHGSWQSGVTYDSFMVVLIILVVEFVSVYIIYYAFC